MIQRIDGWIIDRVAQPAVNAAWARLGIGRRTISLAAMTMYFAAAVLTHTWLCVVAGALCLHSAYFATGVDRRGGLLGFARVLGALCSATMFLAACIMLDGTATLATSMGITASIHLYVSAARDPPRGKRKDCKSAARKFAVQWTWIPARASA